MVEMEKRKRTRKTQVPGLELSSRKVYMVGKGAGELTNTEEAMARGGERSEDGQVARREGRLQLQVLQAEDLNGADEDKSPVDPTSPIETKSQQRFELPAGNSARNGSRKTEKGKERRKKGWIGTAMVGSTNVERLLKIRGRNEEDLRLRRKEGKANGRTPLFSKKELFACLRKSS
jgi:hypothetical protein